MAEQELARFRPLGPLAQRSRSWSPTLPAGVLGEGPLHKELEPSPSSWRGESRTVHHGQCGDRQPGDCLWNGLQLDDLSLVTRTRIRSHPLPEE